MMYSKFKFFCFCFTYFLLNVITQAAICPNCYRYEDKTGTYICSGCGSVVSDDDEMTSNSNADDNKQNGRNAARAAYVASRTANTSRATSATSSNTIKGFSRFRGIPRGRGKAYAIIVGAFIIITLGVILFYDYPILGLILIGLGIVLACCSFIKKGRGARPPEKKFE